MFKLRLTLHYRIGFEKAIRTRTYSHTLVERHVPQELLTAQQDAAERLLTCELTFKHGPATAVEVVHIQSELIERL